MSLLNESLILGGFGGALVAIDQVLTRWHMARKARNQKDVEAAIKDAVRSGMDEIRTEMGERFDANDTATKQTRDEVIKIRATVFPNGGKSLADQVHRIDLSLAELRGEFQAQKEHRR